MQLSSNRTRVFGVIFSVLFSLICGMCLIYQTKIFVDYSDIGRILINSAFIAIFTFIVYRKFRNVTIKISKCLNAEIIIRKDDWKYYFKCAAATFMLLLPVWLAYYPGLNNYDAYSQIKQGIVTEYSQWHPIVHTFWLKFFLYTIGGIVLKSYTAGWAVGMLCQMLIVSFSMSYMHLFLYRIGVPKRIRIALIMGIPVMPGISVMSISSTKDVIFGCFFLLACVCISYWTLNSELCKRTRFIVLYLISLVGTTMFRNNGVYGLIAAFIVGSIYFSLKKSWRFSVLTLCGILIGYLGLHGLQAITKSPDVNFNEALSVPYQQLAFVYKIKGDKLDQGTKSEIEFMIPEVEKYRVNYADMIKFSGKALTNNDGFDRFLKLYFSTGLKYPLHYVEAFIQQNMGYLYIWDNTSSEIQPSGENGWGGYMETEMRALHREARGGYWKASPSYPA